MTTNATAAALLLLLAAAATASAQGAVPESPAVEGDESEEPVSIGRDKLNAFPKPIVRAPSRAGRDDSAAAASSPI